WPRFYASGAGGICTKKIAKHYTTNNKAITWARDLGGLAHILFPPIVRFVYRPSEIENGAIFQGDKIAELREKNGITTSASDKAYWEKIGALALETEQLLPTNRIGLVGLCSHITLQDVSHAMHKNPIRVAQGIAELALGSLLTYHGLGWFF
ncbi:MAG: hypothetical protein EBZ47_09135, partial [Chlamydiae bacterium]|nr:hypothetical protein [Chlamydiota bacterium]